MRLRDSTVGGAIPEGAGSVDALVHMRTVLFLCTGNYYRSRFAEEMFNHRATTDRLSWRAFSRALAIERGINNVGAISPLALAALDARGIAARGRERMPQACTAADLSAALPFACTRVFLAAQPS